MGWSERSIPVGPGVAPKGPKADANSPPLAATAMAGADGPDPPEVVGVGVGAGVVQERPIARAAAEGSRLIWAAAAPGLVVPQVAAASPRPGTVVGWVAPRRGVIPSPEGVAANRRRGPGAQEAGRRSRGRVSKNGWISAGRNRAIRRPNPAMLAGQEWNIRRKLNGWPRASAERCRRRYSSRAMASEFRRPSGFAPTAQ